MNPTTADPAAPAELSPAAAKSQPGVRAFLRKWLKPVASLQLTVTLFALSFGLIFFGTLAQMDNGIWTVVDQYFWSWVVWVPFDLFCKFGQVFFEVPHDAKWGGSFPFPAGKLLGGAMLVNLLAAHLVRFRLTWKRTGIHLIHGGLILLFVGEFITREYAVEQQMRIDVGSSSNFSEDTRHYELAFVDRTDPKAEKVVVVPEAMLRHAKPGTRITDPALPVEIEVVRFMKNSDFKDPAPDVENPATTGAGLKLIAVEQKEESGLETKQRGDIPSAYLRLYPKGSDQPLGTYLISLLLTLQGHADPVTADGKQYRMGLRNIRYYKPYTLHLEEFRFDRYVGTGTPKNYSSRVRLIDPDTGVDREVTISMNSPLRYRGETFYQADFDKKTEQATVLQVVHNPGWIIPYISCVVVGLGLVLHFGIHLSQFLTRRAAA